MSPGLGFVAPLVTYARQPARFFGRRPVFLALLFAYVLSQFFRAFLAVVAGDLSVDLSLDPAGLAGLPAAWFAAFALAQFPIGLALDRYGPRRTLSLGLAVAAVGAAVLAGATGLRSATLAMALIGAGCAPVLMAGYYVIARTYPMHRFATLSSLLLGLGALGDPLSGAPLAALAGAVGWRGAIGLMAAITVVAVATVALFLRDPPPAATTGPASLRHSLRTVIGTRALWPLVPLAFTSYGPVLATRGLWIAPYLGEVHGLQLAGIGLVATAMGFAIAGGALLYAPLVRLFGGVKRTVVAGTAVAAFAWASIGLLGDGSRPLAVAGLLVAGCLGSPFALVMAHARSFLPAHLIGTGVTLMNLFFMGGVATTQWISGRAVEAALAAGTPPATIYGTLFTVFGVALALAVGIYATATPERTG